MHNRKITRREALAMGARGGAALATVSLLPGALVACRGTNESAEGTTGGASGATTLRFGYQAAPAFGLWYAASEKGWFEESGVDLELTLFQGGPPMTEAMAGGSIDVGILGSIPGLVAAASGVFPARIISVPDNAAALFSIVADESIESVEDLAGKRVASALGTNEHYFLSKALQKFGMTGDDVQLLDMDPLTAQEAFVAGEVAATTPLQSSRFLILDQRDDAHVLFESTDFTKPPGPTEEFVINDFILVPEEVFSENQDSLKALLRVYHKRMVEYATSPDTRDEVISDVQSWRSNVVNAPIEKEKLRRYWEAVGFYSAKEMKDFMERDFFQQTLTSQAEFLVETGQIQEVPDMSEHLNLTLIDELGTKESTTHTTQ